MIAIRSFLFTVLFYALNAGLAILGLPILLMPKKARFGFIQFYVRSIYWLERHVLRLDYEVRGREYLPKSGPYIVAAKHQSAYETFKLHILWPRAAVILKRELVRIPLWGRFLAASEPIAIDRKNIRAALKQMTDGAKRVRDQGRVLVIFPQGTRVAIGETAADKPYRIGVAQMQNATGMPVIPLALNSGLFWPRKGGRKMPGKAIFEFLPPVAANLSGKAITHDLETRIEAASLALEAEARKTCPWLKPTGKV